MSKNDIKKDLEKLVRLMEQQKENGESYRTIERRDMKDDIKKELRIEYWLIIAATFGISLIIFLVYFTLRR